MPVCYTLIKYCYNNVPLLGFYPEGMTLLYYTSKLGILNPEGVP